jgi:hypothetical protein
MPARRPSSLPGLYHISWMQQWDQDFVPSWEKARKALEE